MAPPTRTVRHQPTEILAAAALTIAQQSMCEVLCTATNAATVNFRMDAFPAIGITDGIVQQIVRISTTLNAITITIIELDEVLSG